MEIVSIPLSSVLYTSALSICDELNDFSLHNSLFTFQNIDIKPQIRGEDGLRGVCVSVLHPTFNYQYLKLNSTSDFESFFAHLLCPENSSLCSEPTGCGPKCTFLVLAMASLINSFHSLPSSPFPYM